MSFPVRTPHLPGHSVAWYEHKINRPGCTENCSTSACGHEPYALSAFQKTEIQEWGLIITAANIKVE